MVAAFRFRQPGLKRRRKPWVAQEGIPFLLVVAAAFAFAVRYHDTVVAAAFAFLFVVLYLLFRDPHRDVPASPLGVVSPVDGRVLSVDVVNDDVLRGEKQRIRIRVNALGTYTARAPVEGKIMDLKAPTADQVANHEGKGLWLETDEGDDIVLQFVGYRLGLAPRAFVRYGERVGQGERCAHLRLTSCAEVHLPMASTILVEPGQVVDAGSDLVAKLPRPE